MEERLIVGQQALTPDGAVYQIIWDEPYTPVSTPESVALMLELRTPKDAIAGSTCVYNTESADGYPVEWLFSYDGTNWALERVVRGGSAGGGEYKTAEVGFTLNNVNNVGVYGAFTAPNGVVWARTSISSDDNRVLVLCANNGAPSVLTVETGYRFVAPQGDIQIYNDRTVHIQGDGAVTIEPNSSPKPR